MRKVRYHIRKSLLATDLPNHRCDGRKTTQDNQEHVAVRQTAPHDKTKGDRVLVHQVADRERSVQTATDQRRGNIPEDAGRDNRTDAGETGCGGTGQVFPKHPTLTLRDIARIAFSEGLTSNEAADKFGVNVLSIRKAVCKHKLPRLLTEQDKHIMRQLACMNDTQLLSYWNALRLPKNKNTSGSEKEHVKKELERRSIKY